jgi:hypothetical protein
VKFVEMECAVNTERYVGDVIASISCCVTFVLT